VAWPVWPGRASGLRWSTRTRVTAGAPAGRGWPPRRATSAGAGAPRLSVRDAKIR